MQFFLLFLLALGACALIPSAELVAVPPLEQMDCLYGICLEDTADVLSKKGCVYAEDRKDWRCPLPDRVSLYTEMSPDGQVIRVSFLDHWEIEPTIAERIDEDGLLKDERADDPPWLRMAVVEFDAACRSKNCGQKVQELIAQENLFLMKEMGWAVVEEACEPPYAHEWRDFAVHYLRHPNRAGCRTVRGDTVHTQHPRYRSLRFPQYASHFDGSGALGADNRRMQAAK